MACCPNSPRFEDASVASKAIETPWSKKTAGGFAALRDGKLIAYLIGETMSQSWGRCGYVYLPGYAIANGESPALIQDLYTLLGDAAFRLAKKVDPSIAWTRGFG